MMLEVKSSGHLLELLAQQLEGHWQGTGTVQFPTMDTLSYRESLSFVWDKERHLLSYHQSARLLARNEPSHAESGYLLIGPEEVLQWINTQSSGRCEVLECDDGLRDLRNDEIEIVFQSNVIVNDPRMIRSQRRLCFDIDGTYLKYQQGMRTTTHDEFSNHLSARLERNNGDRIKFTAIS